MRIERISCGQRRTLLLSLTTVAMLLSACGGGGSSSTGSAGTSNGASSGSSSSSYTPPNTSVASPSYASGSAENAFFSQINAMRGAMGLSLLAQNPALDLSASQHANYLALNFNSATMGGVDPTTGLLYFHSEDTGQPGFYAATPQARATKAGYAGKASEVGTGWGGTAAIPNTAAQGVGLFNNLMNTVYHRGGMMQDSLRDIGINYALPGYLVADMGYTGVPQPVTGTLVVFPPALGADPYPYWKAGYESPNPTPSVAVGTALGGPISIQSPTLSNLVVNSFTLQDANGNTVPCFELDHSNDPNKNIIATNQAFLVPKQALNLTSTYTALFAGTVDGKAVQKTWSFSTPAAQLTQVTSGPLVLKNGSSVTLQVDAPSGSVASQITFTQSGLSSTVLHYASGTQNTVTLSLDANAVSMAVPFLVTFHDNNYPSVPALTLQVTASP